MNPGGNQGERNWNVDINSNDMIQHNKSFLEQSMERMQKELLNQMQSQMEEQFKKMQEQYKANFPPLKTY